MYPKVDKFFNSSFAALWFNLFYQREREKQVKRGKHTQSEASSYNITRVKDGFYRLVLSDACWNNAINEEIEFVSADNEMLDVFSYPDRDSSKLCALKYLEQWKPNEESSHYYQLLYLLVCISYISKYEKTFESSHREHYSSLVFNDLHKAYLCAMFDQYSIVKSKSEDTFNYPNIRYCSNTLVETECKECLIENKEEAEGYRAAYLLSFLYAFGLAITDSSLSTQELYRQAQAKIALECLKFFHELSEYEDLIFFSRKAVFTLDAHDRLNAFNLLGTAAINTGRFQLAYDTYYSWISNDISENLKNALKLTNDDCVFIKDNMSSYESQRWINDLLHRRQIAIMYANISYVYRRMGNYSSALKSIRKAIELYPQSLKSHISAGYVYTQLKMYSRAIYEYEEGYKLAETDVHKLTVLRMLLCTDIFSVHKTDLKMFVKRSNEFINIYQRLRETNNINADRTISEELARGNDLFFVLKSCDELSKKNIVIKSHILNLFYFSEQLLSALENKEHREIAYYASLDNMKRLFNEVELNDSNKSANCLTMMHARYMNDPEEGLVILKDLEKIMNSDAAKLRDELYEQKHVFLKSFTSLIDQLNMWSMYGRDLSEGKDCNGCCICFDLDTFNKCAQFVVGTDSVNPEHICDDYTFYNVAYLKDGNYYVGNTDIPSDEVKRLVSRIKGQVNKMFRQLDAFPNSEDESKVRECIIRLLEKPMFLIKDYSYHMENECRLIISRDINDSLDINKTESNPPRLFINPPFQVFPNKIIIGPKVDNPDYWKPYIQFELSKIKKKWNFSVQDDYNPEIIISEINIR